jgi:GT2 family glycosyltransferase
LLDSLEEQAGLEEVLVADNGGGGEEIDAARERAGVRIIDSGGNVGFAAASNLAAAEARGDVLVFLNPDTVAAPGSIEQLARTLENPDVGIAMARLSPRRAGEAQLVRNRGSHQRHRLGRRLQRAGRLAGRASRRSCAERHRDGSPGGDLP